MLKLDGNSLSGRSVVDHYRWDCPRIILNIHSSISSPDPVIDLLMTTRLGKVKMD